MRTRAHMDAIADTAMYFDVKTTSSTGAPSSPYSSRAPRSTNPGSFGFAGLDLGSTGSLRRWNRSFCDF